MGGIRLKDIVFDLETYPNVFTAVFADPEEKRMYVFEISNRKDDSIRLRKFLTKVYKEQRILCGFNNLGFDSPILHRWLSQKGMTVNEIYEYAMEIIEDMKNGEKFKHLVPKNREWLKQRDLYKIYHYDNVARATSLKMLEFNMRSKNIEDLPFEVGSILTDDEIDVLIEYNKHDVLETLKFYNLEDTQEKIALREELSERYGVDFTNHNDGRIGKEFFTMRLEKETPDACYRQLPNGQRTMRQTKRKQIKFSDLNLDYVQFETPEFSALLKWLKQQVITETKGVFSDIPEHELGDLAKYCNLVTKKKKLKTEALKDKDLAKELRKRLRTEELTEDEVKEIQDKLCGVPSQKDIDEMMSKQPKGWVERTELKSGKISYNFMWRIAETINVVYDGFEYVYGTGGIHASVSGETFRSDDEWVILDYDYASMYPNIFIANRIHPEHLGEGFCDIYQDLYIERKKYPKGTNLNLAIKLALNTVYGATNDKYSVFYDPKATINCTVLGQLTLSVLAEKLVTQVPQLKMVQCNTDGLTVYVKREYENQVDEIVSEWDKVCGLTMEKATYDLMAIADVNNYIAIYEGNSGIKLNGRYEYRDALLDPDKQGLEMHKNKSALIAKEAAVKFITEGVPVERTIKSCTDPYLFMLRTKVPRSSRLYLRTENGDEQIQNITRYHIAKDGGKLIKVMPALDGKEGDREFAIDSEWLVNPCNNMDDFNWNDLNYDYYIAMANKLVEGVGL